MKSDQDRIREYVTHLMSGYIGKKMHPETVKKAIRETVLDAITNTTGVESCSKVEVKMLWKSMSLKEKFKWFLFNRFPFKKEGDAHRASIRAHWDLAHQLEQWDIRIPGHSVAYPVTPPYLESSPKSVVVCNAWVNLAQPIKYITVDLSIEKENG